VVGAESPEWALEMTAALTERDPPPPEVVARRVELLRKRIEAAGRDPSTVRIVAVTKGYSPPAVTSAMAAGVIDIGENYATPLLAKAGCFEGRAQTGLAPCWHYLGAIQRRRVKDLAGVVGVWQTVGRVVEGEAIARRAPGAKVFVQVECTGIPGRNGCAPSRVPGLARSLVDLGLDVSGIMTIAPPGPAAGAREVFLTVARLSKDLGLREVSMGMSDDLEVALETGTTMIRIGRALFGDAGEVGSVSEGAS
jgi:PLP dependent protein